jgi:hypothetical protein
MMAIQICCLAGIVVKGHKNLNNLVYHVKSLGAAKQLEHLDNDKRETMQTRILQDFQLEAYGLAERRCKKDSRTERHPSRKGALVRRLRQSTSYMHPFPLLTAASLGMTRPFLASDEMTAG